MEQANITSFFTGGSRKRSSSSEPKTSVKKISKIVRNLVVSTAENWKKTTLLKYGAEDWLSIGTDEENKFVTSLKCLVCKNFEDRIRGIKNFNFQWSQEGCKRLQHNAAVLHAESEPHKQAYNLFLKTKGLDPYERSQKLKELRNENRQNDIFEGLATMQKHVENTQKKFNVAFFVAKEELPVAKYTKILELEEKHGVVIGTAYRNERSGGIFMDYISKWYEDKLKSVLLNRNFFSVLLDGSTDSSVTEKEAMFVLYFDPTPPGSDTIKVQVRFLTLAEMKAGDADGVIEQLQGAFQELDIDYNNKLIGFGSDGAAINSGKRNGIITKLRADMPWMMFGWCVAHRLELSLKDGLTGTEFDDVDNMILNLYYIYKKSPKKLRQLKDLCELYDVAETGCRPKRGSGKLSLISTYKNSTRILSEKKNKRNFFSLISIIKLLKVRVNIIQRDNNVCFENSTTILLLQTCFNLIGCHKNFPPGN